MYVIDFTYPLINVKFKTLGNYRTDSNKPFLKQGMK